MFTRMPIAPLLNSMTEHYLALFCVLLASVTLSCQHTATESSGTWLCTLNSTNTIAMPDRNILKSFAEA